MLNSCENDLMFHQVCEENFEYLLRIVECEMLWWLLLYFWFSSLLSILSFCLYTVLVGIIVKFYGVLCAHRQIFQLKWVLWTRQRGRCFSLIFLCKIKDCKFLCCVRMFLKPDFAKKTYPIKVCVMVYVVNS